MSHMPQARFQDRTRVDLPLTLPWLCPRPASGLLTRQRSALTLEEAGEPLLFQPWGGGAMPGSAGPQVPSTPAPATALGTWGFGVSTQVFLGFLRLCFLLLPLP